jgi:arginyl-tRNA synthetase
MKLREVKNRIGQVIEELWGPQLDSEKFEVAYPADSTFGDVTTNAAMVFARELGRPPRALAEELAQALGAAPEFVRVDVAGPGFINIQFDDALLLGLASQAPDLRPDHYAGKVVVAEYSDPNPFKALHAGHLYTTLVGDSIARLLEISGATVHRVNFGGDVGLHVARCLWGILQELGGEHPERLQDVPEKDRADWMSRHYVAGAAAYESSEQAKKDIAELNARVYRIHAEQDHDSPLAKIYWTGRTWSYDYFDQLYKQLGVTPFEKYYPESATTPLGIEKVKAGQAQGIFVESDGAVVYRGEDEGLHTRVFLTSQGLPTYEAKDLGLVFAKWQDYRFDISVIITGNDIIEYMKVVQAAMAKLEPSLAGRTIHLTHSMIRMAGGVKMSSRKGNGLRAMDIIESARAAAVAGPHEAREDSVMAAVKYAFLRQRAGGGDISYDPAESVSLEGNSGPYLQYAHARARSILAKVKTKPHLSSSKTRLELEPDERELARRLTQYVGVVDVAAAELRPHHICTYLYELAQTFNRFYEHNRVLGDEREEVRLLLVSAYAAVLEDGLSLLGIEAPHTL